MNEHSGYVRFTPESGHEFTDVRLTPDFVRFTPVNGHYSGTPICPFLTHNGHNFDHLLIPTFANNWICQRAQLLLLSNVHFATVSKRIRH